MGCIMNNKDVLNQLLDDMIKSSKVNANYIVCEEQIIDECLTSITSRNNIEIDYKKDIIEKKIKSPFNLEDLELRGEYVNCNVCGAYTIKREVNKLIEGYVDCTIAICRISKNVYKIDATLLQLNSMTNLKYETNMQCILTIIFD